MQIAQLVEKCINLWETTQVELHGFYSVERVRELIHYRENTSIIRALAVLMLMPWPSVIITILVDLIPLRPSSEGLQANYLFIVRTFLSFWVTTIAINLQFKHTVPTSPLTKVQIIVSSAFTAVLTTGVMYVLSLTIGFPLPFEIITVSPAWVAFMLVPLISFLHNARSDPVVWLQIVNTLKTWVCLESLVIIYPMYFYLFTTLPAKAKTPFVMLLPIIKIILRNVMSRTVVHLKDEIPEVVLMNVEVFNSLFMSYCMQNTPSVWAALGLIAIDADQMLASLHDVEVIIQYLRSLQELVDSERSQQGRNDSMCQRTKKLGKMNILMCTEEILDRSRSARAPQIETMAAKISTETTLQVIQLKVSPKPKNSRGLSEPIRASPRTHAQPKLVKGPSLRKVFSSCGFVSGSNKLDIPQLEVEYALRARKVLYSTEFLLLINYVEVIVPVIFCKPVIFGNWRVYS
ncbi:unnamed protein product [Phytophthora fragariaefolia]|uniref:Unnamed protein product n=1 Tax=Phytophthora fragariaefolia TaxID=1490495 RepID=A0A9W7CNY2_9STRA|nr:unnamed protein product [Phytophthora fragariaefolia]